MDPKLVRPNPEPVQQGVNLELGLLKSDKQAFTALTLKYEVSGHVTSALRVLMDLDQVDQMIFALSDLREQMGGGPLATPKPKIITPRRLGS